ncbi:MAG TPA: glutathione S-transferase N-terminal domain-containing protein [Caulobacteraceae bacterium]|nr:glutathione S-transferase N-terminal domain-containing protein [Caulobacteraceae bacterium]
MTEAFRPTVFLKDKCPFCMKIRIFLLESGLKDRVTVKNFTPGTDAEQQIRDEVSPHMEKVSFPAAEVAAGEYLADSDGIIARLAEGETIDPAQMPVLKAYLEGPFQSIMTLFRENRELKERLG